jgi:hypothetical protein
MKREGREAYGRKVPRFMLNGPTWRAVLSVGLGGVSPRKTPRQACRDASEMCMGVAARSLASARSHYRLIVTNPNLSKGSTRTQLSRLEMRDVPLERS